ncbi:MAG: hypothetical protein R2854_15450 [Caldilineaceae bacterium]
MSESVRLNQYVSRQAQAVLQPADHRQRQGPAAVENLGERPAT